MAIGIFGSQKLADVSNDDVDVLFAYSPDRESIGDVQMQPLFENINDGDFKKMFGADGVYRLRLPAEIFKELGFYTILIKPKTFETTILDCSNIISSDATQTQISRKGIVIPNIAFKRGGSLVGYQIEYFNNKNEKIKNMVKITTSSDLVTVSTNTTNLTPTSIAYILDENGSNIFLTVTPDEGGIISSSQPVNIGRKGQKILLSNTFFNPTLLEVEMVDHTIKTLSYALYGNSTRDLETGKYTIFDENNKIFRQYNLFTRKKLFEEGNVDIREKRSEQNVDFSQTFEDLSEENI